MTPIKTIKAIRTSTDSDEAKELAIRNLTREGREFAIDADGRIVVRYADTREPWRSIADARKAGIVS